MKKTSLTPGFNKILSILLLTSLIITSCKDETEDPITDSEEIEIANESTSAEALTEEELLGIDEELALNPKSGRVSGAGCATVTWNEQSKTVTVDFGDGCVGVYGRERSGKVVITYGGEFGDHLANRIISFENYFVNNKQITGTIELRDFNTDSDGHLTATRKRVNLTVHFPDGNTFTSNGSTTVTWIEGAGDDDRANDVLSIAGAYEGISSRGRSVNYTILEPVIVSYACYSEGGFARVDGKTELTISGRRERTRVVDYGDGQCDQTVTITINGKEFTLAVM